MVTFIETFKSIVLSPELFLAFIGGIILAVIIYTILSKLDKKREKKRLETITERINNQRFVIQGRIVVTPGFVLDGKRVDLLGQSVKTEKKPEPLKKNNENKKPSKTSTKKS